jgi:hypothetical protein
VRSSLEKLFPRSTWFRERKTASLSSRRRDDGDSAGSKSTARSQWASQEPGRSDRLQAIIGVGVAVMTSRLAEVGSYPTRANTEHSLATVTARANPKRRRTDDRKSERLDGTDESGELAQRTPRREARRHVMDR